MNLLFRVFLVVAGLIFAASLAVAFVLLLGVWLLRSGWARITGRPVMPLVWRMRPSDGFARMYRSAQRSRTPRADSVRASGRFSDQLHDITDVEPK